MSLKIGIPRALLYHRYDVMWKTFFEELGFEVIISSKTSKEIVEQGLKNTINELCLPVKICFGHILELKDKVDYIFIPSVVTEDSLTFNCPKIIGIADMIRNSFDDLPPIISPNYDSTKKFDTFYNTLNQIRQLEKSPIKILKAFKKALSKKDEKQFNINKDKINLGIIGRPYVLSDQYLIEPMLNKLKTLGVNPLLMDNISWKSILKEEKNLNRMPHWTMGKEMLCAVKYFLQKKVEGIVYVVPFGCSTDSFIDLELEELIKDTPFLKITLDEHEAQAGLVTRLEAFVDML